MIAPLRRMHRRSFTVLAVLVPAVLALGFFGRHPEREAPGLRSPYGVELRSAAEHFSVIVLSGGGASVRLHTPVPDPLLYWTAAASGDGVDPAARLVGVADPTARYDLPQAGYLVLYSGGHRRVVDFTRLEARQ